MKALIFILLATEVAVAEPIRVVNGQICDMAKVGRRMNAEYLRSLTNGCLQVRLFEDRTRQELIRPPYDSLRSRGNFLGGIPGPPSYREYKERNWGDQIVLTNAPRPEAQSSGNAELSLLAVRCGEVATPAGAMLELWDVGTEPSKAQLESFKSERAEQEAKAKADELAHQKAYTLALQRIQSDQKAAKEAREMAMMLKSATEGAGWAQYSMGMRYLAGRGVEANRAEAVRWLAAACTNGHAQASNELSRLGGRTSP